MTTALILIAALKTTPMKTNQCEQIVGAISHVISIDIEDGKYKDKTVQPDIDALKAWLKKTKCRSEK